MNSDVRRYGIGVTIAFLVVLILRVLILRSVVLDGDRNPHSTDTRLAESGEHATRGPGETAHQNNPYDSLRLYDPESPPKRPPDPNLLVRSTSANKEPRAQERSTLVYYNWLMDKKGSSYESYEMSPPISWPKPLDIQRTDEVIIDLGTDIRPQKLQIFAYKTLGLDGVPDGQPESVFNCESGRIDDANKCALLHYRNVEEGSQQVMVPIRSWSGKYFLAVSATWMVPAREAAVDPSQPPFYNASWLFSVEVID